MTNTTVGLVCGLTGGLALAMFIFICWWFPRHWKKGNAMDIAEYEEEKRAREAYFAMIAEQRAAAERDGKTVDASQLEAGVAKPPPRVYVPPVAGY